MKNYTATVSREGRWWMIRVDGIDGLTQARRLVEAELMAREFVAVALDLELSDVAVEVHLDTVGSVEGVSDRVHRIAEERRQAAELEAEASREAAVLAKDLVAADVALRDVGTILGVSHQRAHQLVSS
jgi:hypothetical protein